MTASDNGRRGASVFTRSERQEIFKRMVSREIEKGPLPYRRRRKLMGYAAQIGIRPFDASLLIAEAQREAGQLDPITLQPAGPLNALIHPERWPIWFKLTVGFIVVALLDLAILHILRG